MGATIGEQRVSKEVGILPIYCFFKRKETEVNTQLEQVMSHLKSRKRTGITSWHAIESYGITRLAHYIHQLRVRGWQIEDQYEHDPDRPSHKWKRYWLTKAPSMAAMKRTK